MCDLAVADELHSAIEPHLDEWARMHPGEAVLVFMRDGRVCVKFTRSYDAALRNQEQLELEIRKGSIVIELSDHVLML